MDGISYLKNNKPYVSKTTSYIKNLDNLFIPSWKYNDFKTYSNLPSLTTYKNTPYAPVSTSRGCPYKCPFCNNRYQPPYRARSINHVKKELDYLKKIGVKEIVFTDDIFNFPEKRAQDLLKMIIRRKYGFSLSFMGIRLDIINSKTLDLMKQAGAYFFQFGVQNTSTNIEKKIGRNIKNGKMKLIHNNRYAKKIGITTNAQFIYGFPEENYNDYYSNLIFSKILGSDFVCFFKLTPYPGTEYAEKIKNIEKIPSKDFNFNSKNEKLNLSRISCKNTVKFVNLSYKKFFLHKLKIIKTFLKIPKNRYFLKTTFYEYINYLNNIGLIKSFKKNILKNKKQAFQGKQEL